MIPVLSAWKVSIGNNNNITIIIIIEKKSRPRRRRVKPVQRQTGFRILFIFRGEG